MLEQVSTSSSSSSSSSQLLAVRPRVEMRVRAGTLDDVAFMDSLQKATTKQVGFMPRAQLEGKVRAGHVLVAEVHEPRALATGACDSVAGGVGGTVADASGSSGGTVADASGSWGGRVGYLIAADQYFKRDDVGVIYQMNVVPAYRRGLVAASLLKAQFERSAYGCRLYCCWCAQDIEANQFWEAMGFVALAFRSGSRTKGKGGAARTHIFWQKRIRQGDEVTPWWFPSKTAGGAMNEDRIVLPIPPGVNWRDAMPVVLPEGEGMPNVECQLPDEKKAVERRRVDSSNRKSAIANRQSVKPAVRARVQFGPPVMEQTEAAASEVVGESPALQTTAMAVVKAKPQRKAKKADPRLIAAARELRDRWLDEVNAGRFVGQGKYDVTRVMSGSEGTVRALGVTGSPPAMLPAA
ncbi:MAG TPA: hypothetical protein VGN72_15625 [Tepidisphaeraceae bacterium]|jgi:hypothetical protein|nr:hypothetical protein [Tepidisphaeraceae bacterium]